MIMSDDCCDLMMMLVCPSGWVDGAPVGAKGSGQKLGYRTVGVGVNLTVSLTVLFLSSSIREAVIIVGKDSTKELCRSQ